MAEEVEAAYVNQNGDTVGGTLRKESNTKEVNAKLNVLSNHKISIPQNYITEILRTGSANTADTSTVQDNIAPSEVSSSENKVFLPLSNIEENDTRCTIDSSKTKISIKSEKTHNTQKPLELSDSLNEASENDLLKQYVKQTGRKRKNINYSDLADGVDESIFENSPSEIPLGKRKRGRPHTSTSNTELPSQKVSSKTDKANYISFDKSGEAGQLFDGSGEVLEGKRKRGRPKIINRDTKTTPLNVSNKSCTVNDPLGFNSTVSGFDEVAAVQIIPDTEDCNKTKKKPRGRYSTNSQQSKLLNTVFQQINAHSNLNVSTEGHLMTPSEDTPLSSSADIDNKPNVIFHEPLITCAVCNLQFTKSSWQQHKYRSHNNLAWKVGDPPLDLNNQTLVMSILSDLYKRKKPMYCENCGVVKKSPLGYLSHKSVCSNTTNDVISARIKCEYCEHRVLPVSMAAHLKICRGLNTYKNMDLDYPESTQEVEEQITTGKRKTAAKAEIRFKELHSSETSAPKKVRLSWYVNFDFHPTGFGKKRIKNEIKQKEFAHCWFANCDFKSSSVEDMENHIWRCKHKTIHGYTCKKCMFTFENEDQIVEHSKRVHSRFSVDDNYLEEDYQNIKDESEADYIVENLKKNFNLSKKGLLDGITFLLKQRHYPPSTAIRYPPAVDWSLQFCKQNFSTPNLFPSWRVTVGDFDKLDPSMYCKYLPSQKYSICTASIESNAYTDLLTLNYQWKRYKLFESDLLHDDASTIFCGGPVSAMAWAPTPFNITECEQVLAISINNKLTMGYPLDQLYKEPGLIQFWNCGFLANCDNLIVKPKLEYCISHDKGPIWCLEWCPSGVYDIDHEDNFLQRLGLLAVGSADSYVYIYCICAPGSLSGKMYHPKPTLKLALDTISEIAVNGLESHPTTLSWSKARGHQYLAVGYANGMIAIFDLLSTASLLITQSNDGQVKTMRPYQVFNAHYHTVTALHLFHLNNGRRWLMSGSLDRSIKYWDLDNPNVPISNFTKFIVTDGVWLNYWLSTLHTYDDCCGGGLTYSSIYQLRNFESETASAMHSNSHVSTISGSEWTNSFVQGNVVGEIVGFFPHQLFYGLDCEKALRRKKAVLGYARLVDKNLSEDQRVTRTKNTSKKGKSKKSDTNSALKVDAQSEEFPPEEYVEPSSFEEADEKYGLVFCDMHLGSLEDLPANLSSYYKSNGNNKLLPNKPNIYPLQLVNKVVINSNHNSYLYYAAGYQAGFVRILPLKFINKRKS